jgi:NAD(P)H-nitrite reductase large subunit
LEAIVAKTVICLCRDVTKEDIERAVAVGYGDIETIKRFTGASTGPCQGKACLESLRELVASLTGRDIDEISIPPRRPPLTPVRLGTLAAKDHL